MKICFVAEGCYPYSMGGVSSWIDSMIRSFPDYEFILLTIVSDRSQRGQFSYELPDNLTEVHEIYLEDYNWTGGALFQHKVHLNKEQKRALRGLILDQQVEWDELFALFQGKKFSIDDLLMGPDFFQIVKECYNKKYPQTIFSDFIWTMRSIYLPLFIVLKNDLPKADLYHCVATGYAGVLGSMAKIQHHSKLLISEHGIYTREREEELIKATWVAGLYKGIWIDQFKKMSLLAYQRADLVTSLYPHARELQLELGCPPEKTMITPNGIDVERLENLPGPTEEDQNFINIGAVLRVTPIKDVKTMLQAFSFAKQKLPSLKLWIMGPWEENDSYAKECFDLVSMMKISDVEFTGRVDIRQYLGRMDMTILTSISEGQPLTILESFAAHKPVIATDVGDCRGLLYGNGDDLGDAGILCHVMNIQEITQAMITMGSDAPMREKMGQVGYERVCKFYRIQDMKAKYAEIYQEFEEEVGKEESK